MPRCCCCCFLSAPTRPLSYRLHPLCSHNKKCIYPYACQLWTYGVKWAGWLLTFIYFLIKKIKKSFLITYIVWFSIHSVNRAHTFWHCRAAFRCFPSSTQPMCFLQSWLTVSFTFDLWLWKFDDIIFDSKWTFVPSFKEFPQGILEIWLSQAGDELKT